MSDENKQVPPGGFAGATGSAARSLEWQSPDGRWNRMSSSRPTKEGIISLAKWFFRDWLEMPPMRLVEVPPNSVLDLTRQRPRNANDMDETT